MRCLFVHDFKYIEYDERIYGDGQFEYNNLWKRKYLKYFDEMIVVARGKYSKDKALISNRYQLDGPGVAFVNTDSLSSFARIMNTPNVYRTIQNEIEGCEFVIVRLPSIQGLIACSLLVRKNKPYIIEVVGSAFASLWYHGGFLSKILAPVLHALNRFFIYKAPNVIYVTTEYLQKVYKNKNNKIACSDVVISNNPNVLNKRLNKIQGYSNKDIFTIGLVGSYNVKYKGHKLALKSLAKIHEKHNVNIHFLGSGDRKWIEKLAKSYGVQDRIFFDKPVSAGEQMNDWLDSMDLLIIPSKTEGLPRVALEYMSRGGVILATKVGDIPHIIDQKYTINKNDYSLLAKKIIQLLSNPHEMATAAKNNYQIARSYDEQLLNERRSVFINNIIRKLKQGILNDL